MEQKSDKLEFRVDELIAADEAAELDELAIEELDTVAAGLSISSLATAACPWSSFSSVSN